MKNTDRILIAVACCSIVAGCSKDYEEVVDNPKEYASVYMAQATESPMARSFVMTSETDTIIVSANYGGLDFPDQDIKVSFKVSPELVEVYNKENLTSYPIMPDGSYEMEQTEAIIPKGSLHTQPIYIKLKTLNYLDGIGGYLLPVSIETDGPVPVNESLRTSFLLVNAIYQSHPFTDLDRTEWSVVSVSSEESSGEGPANGRAIFAFDGNSATYWHTQWKNAKPGPPHSLTVNLGKVTKIHGIKLLGRLENTGMEKTTGNPKDILVETSMDNVNWNYKENFTLENIKENQVYFAYAQQAQYLRITVVGSFGDTYMTHIAEINAF